MNKSEIFLDVFAQKNNFLSGIEARTRIVFIVLALIVNLTSTSIYTPVSIAIFSLILLLIIRIPAKLLLFRLAMPVIMAMVILLIQIFFYGETPLFILPIGGFAIVGYAEGLNRGILIICRVLGGVALILLLSMSTPADKLFAAAAWFRVPKIFIEITMLVYRYIFVLIEELIIMKDAQKVRLGYCNWHQSMKSLSTLGACLILRAYDRAERVFEAMIIRGYTGSQLNCNLLFQKKDTVVALYLSLILAGFYFIGHISK